MSKKIDRTSEEGYNNFGSKMIILEYRNQRDIDIYFPKYDWNFKHAHYNNFKRGNVKCPYEPRYYGVGYIGEGKYTVKENGKRTDKFDIWYSFRVSKAQNGKIIFCFAILALFNLLISSSLFPLYIGPTTTSI